VDAFCQVVRVFEDDAVYHIWSNPDPAREVEFVHGEMVLHDLVFIEKRVERIDKGLKKGKDDKAEREKVLLGRFREALEKDVPLRNVEIVPDDALLIQSYPFLTRKACIIALMWRTGPSRIPRCATNSRSASPTSGLLRADRRAR